MGCWTVGCGTFLLTIAFAWTLSTYLHIENVEYISFAFWVACVIACYVIPKRIDDNDKRQQMIVAKERADEQKEQARIRQEKINSLLASRVLITDMSEQLVLCSNRHRYKFRDFHIDTPSIEYYTDWEECPPYRDKYGDICHTREVQRAYTGKDSKIGCPLCKSTLFTFERTENSQYMLCKKCEYWHKGPSCPICDD